ncbi:zinc finger protein 311 [Drosophila kikkawai]|uniref:Zinc finger protein 311 n=1 Tax=Drosophila kikkawai TaxID=30033 RepID=A0A6P4J414_DROKI|nr:zinc finger protein 16 [Drosophila kikkawai]
MSLANPVELAVAPLSHCQNHQEAALCRVCNVPSSSCLPLFRQHLIAGKVTTLAKVLSYCTGLEILEKEHFLPQHICPGCMVKMQASLQFKRSVHRMDKQLRQRQLDLSQGKGKEEMLSEEYIFVLDEQHLEMEQGHPIEVEVEICRKQEGQPMSTQMEGEELAKNWTKITEKHHVEAELLEEELYEIVEEPAEESLEVSSELPKPPKKAISRKQCRKPQTPSLQCQICDKQLSTSNSFKYHMQLHGTATPYVCRICGESFKTRNAHDGHVTLHDPNNPNRCSTCGKVYRQASSLRTHLLTHSGIKPFECTVCGKRLTQRSGYKKHMLTHTGEKPHGCDICGRSFRYSSNLIAHKRCHSQEKPHQCQVCHKRSFGSTSELNRHMLVHSSARPFACGECGKSFKRQVSLGLHQQLHKEGRNRCGKVVAQAEEGQAES